MVKIDVALIKKLRDETGAPVIRVKKVLEEVGGSESKALSILKMEGFEKAQKYSGRETGQGKIFSYVHHNGKVAALVELLCETDFVARNDLFDILGRDLAMQIASMGEKSLASQEFIKDPTKKVEDLVGEVIAKTGENIKIGRLYRIELGR